MNYTPRQAVRPPIHRTPANLELTAKVVTSVDGELHPQIQERTLLSLAEVLVRRARRLIEDRQTFRWLRGPLLRFVHNLLGYYRTRGLLDDYTLTNLATALVCADDHGPDGAGTEDYSTFIRRLNPTDPQSESCFILGREGRIGDPQCPLSSSADHSALRHLPPAKAHMFFAFFRARGMDKTRCAPRVPAENFLRLIPGAITSHPALEEAFLDVCFSDGAWELYQLYRGGSPC